MPFARAIEIGWRLARPFWGRGLATEAGNVVLRFGFGELGLGLGLGEIDSFTSTVNERSRRVMERLGMSRDPTKTLTTFGSLRAVLSVLTSSTKCGDPDRAETRTVANHSPDEREVSQIIHKETDQRCPQCRDRAALQPR